MVEIDIVYQGGLRSLATHGPSGATVPTDAPRDNEGQGASFSPTDLVATALGSCILTVMGIVARRRGVALEGARCRVVKRMVATPVRRIGELEVVLDMPPGLDAETRRVLEAAAATCPVKKSLHPDVAIPVGFRYPD